jgi:hypothetical protein
VSLRGLMVLVLSAQIINFLPVLFAPPENLGALMLCE